MEADIAIKKKTIMVNSTIDDDATDDVEDEREVIGCTPNYLSHTHRDEILAIVDSFDSVNTSDTDSIDEFTTLFESRFDRYRKLLDLYQEQPQLLDPLLDTLLKKLLNSVHRSRIATRSGYIGALGNVAMQFIAHLTKVCGCKVMLCKLPHQVEHFATILDLLEHAIVDDDGEEYCADAKYVLLLWLQILCKNPFDLCRFDGKRPIVESIIDICRSFLDSGKVDRTQMVAALLLAQLLTRPDVKTQHLRAIIDAQLVNVSEILADFDAHTGDELVGSYHLLANIFKEGKRDDLLPIAYDTLDVIVKTPLNRVECLLRKLTIKLVQRIGLVFLRPKIANWRYRRGNRSLADNLNGGGDKQLINGSHIDSGDTIDDNIDYDIPGDRLELVLNVLLTGLKDRDTIVRWSAAKGIGRVTARLPRHMADDVIGSVLDSCFGPCANDSAWHGGCLSLAELARRGYLLPARLPDVVDIVIKALVFDQQQGRHSVGAHIRDAACYICWAFARAYDPQEIAPYVHRLAGALLTVAVFDREINVRRAASAAFQENVGRQGSFPHGIDILSVVDYFAVGQRRRCFHKLCIFVGQYQSYTRILIDHLVELKIGHWDQQIRILSSEALHRFVAIDADYFIDRVLAQLLHHSTATNLFYKQGALFAIGQVTAALITINRTPPSVFIDDIVKLPAMSTNRTGGELIRIGLNMLIGCLAAVDFPLDDNQLDIWHAVLDRNMKDVKYELRSAAADAMQHLWSYYERSDKRKTIALEKVQNYIDAMIDASVEKDRIAGALALGALCLSIAQLPTNDGTTVGNRALYQLIQSSTPSHQRDSQWAESRRDCINAINRLINHIIDINTDNVTIIYRCVLSSLDDYTIDKRGDIGHLVRDAALPTMANIIIMGRSLINDNDIDTAIGKLLQQSCEKNDGTRMIAAQSMLTILACEHIHLRYYEILKEVYLDDETTITDWHLGRCFKRLAKLMQCPVYLYNVVLGFVTSAGGANESTKRAAIDAFLGYISDNRKNIKLINRLMDILAQIFNDFALVNRVVIPMLSVLDQLLTSGLLSIYETEPDSCSSLVRLIELTAQQTNASKQNPQKIRMSIAVLCGVLQFNSNSVLWTKAVTIVVQSLVSTYPTIRRNAADQLYEALITFGCLDNHTEVVLTLLSETEWNCTDRDKLIDIQMEIASRLGVTC